MPSLTVHSHPLLALRAFLTQFPAPLGSLPDAAYSVLLSASAQAPFTPTDDVRTAIRDLLRHGGFKPTGRSKPASEYLLKAVREGLLTPINLAVDACNVVSLHSQGRSSFDLGRLGEPGYALRR